MSKKNSVVIVAEVDLETGEYNITFRNKSKPGEPMELSRIKSAFLKVAVDFNGEKSDEAPVGLC
jgi:hypothetical protein